MLFSEQDNLELLSLIWLDSMADATQENRETQEKLRSIVNYVRVFETCHECQYFIEKTLCDKQEKVILVVSGRLGQQFIAQVHHLKPITSIFVYCIDKDKNESWAKHYPKIRAVIVELNSLLKEIERDSKSDEQKINEFVDVFVDRNLILEFILDIESSLMDKKCLLDICFQQYANNSSGLRRVEEFQHLYSSLDALKWFINETFLYRLLQRALHRNHLALIYLLRFFVRDLHEQLSHCSTTTERVYRGQLMSIDQIDFLNKCVNEQYLHFNTFIIAKLARDEVVKSLQNASNTNGLHKVLFEIDPNQIGKQYEYCVIFPLTTYVRIIGVKCEKRLWTVNMVVYDSYCQTEARSRRNPFDLAHFIRQQGQFDEAEKLFSLLLSQYPSLRTFAYNGLGRIAQDKGQYKNALEFYFKSLDTMSLEESRSHCLNNIGCAYDDLEKYNKAIRYYSEALTLMKDELNQSICLNNIAVTYAKSNQYELARECFQRCLVIRKRHLCANHIQTGLCHANLGLVTSLLAQFEFALENYNLSLKCFTSDMSQYFRAIVYQNMARIFQEQNKFEQALKFYKTSEKFFRQFRPNDHPNLIHIKEQIIQLKQLNQTYF